MQSTQDDRGLRDQWKERKLRPRVLFTHKHKIFLKNNDTEEKAPVCARMRAGVGGEEEGQKKKRGDSLRMFDPMPQGNYSQCNTSHSYQTFYIYIHNMCLEECYQTTQMSKVTSFSSLSLSA